MTAPITIATCFDSHYAVRGLSMLESLFRRAMGPVRVVVLALDDPVRAILAAARMDVHVITEGDLVEALGEDVARAKENRSRKEWCWTCGSLVTEYAMRAHVHEGESLLYVDADYLWFRDPAKVVSAMRGMSLGFQPHALPPDEEVRLGGNGKFNVGIVGFRHGPPGLAALRLWYTRCLEWCHEGAGDRSRGQYCGDQGYLDMLALMFGDALVVFDSPGLCYAPWNMKAHRVTPGPDVDGVPLVAYHFHEYRGPDFRSGYPITPEALAHVYAPYDSAHNRWTAFLEEFNQKGA